MIKLLSGAVLAAGALLASGAAHAQTGGAAVPGHAQPVLGTEKNDSTRMSNDDRDANVAAERAVRESREGGERPKAGRARPAKPSDLVIGAAVRDSAGVPIGSIERIDPDGVQILTGDGKHAKIAADGFGKDRAGLLIAMTKADFDKAVAASLGE